MDSSVQAKLCRPCADVRACVQLALKLLGLEVCADTIVGDQLMRGISGGQKKRVTTGLVISAKLAVRCYVVVQCIVCEVNKNSCLSWDKAYFVTTCTIDHQTVRTVLLL